MASGRPRPINVKGFRDYFGEEVTIRQDVLDRITGVYRRYGFEPLETPAVETLAALGKFLPDTDRPNEGVFAWQEDDEWLALRYDLTAPLARVAAQYRNTLPLPYRRYATGVVWRNEKPGPGRYRQFYQCDADTVGSATMAADAEMCSLACEILESLGIGRGDYQLRLNNRKLLDGTLAAAGIVDQDGSGDSDARRATVLRAMDKLDRVGEAGVRDLLGKGRLDGSGDFTAGAGLGASQIDLVMAFLGAGGSGPEATLSALGEIVSRSRLGAEGVAELSEIMELLAAQGAAASQCVVDPSVVRGLGYYTGPVMEAVLTAEIRDRKGRRRQFGSVVGGGRYDGLVRRFTGQDLPATGISVGVDRLLAVQEALRPDRDPVQGPVVVTVMDRDRLGDYQAMVAELRSAGISAEMFLGNAKNFGRQMKYADLRNAPLAIIEGEDEHQRGVVQIKDLVLGKRIADAASHEEWKSRPMQEEVSRADLVNEVARKLHSAGHGDAGR